MLSRRIPDKNIWVIYTAILLLGIAYGVSIAVLAIHLANHGIPKLAMGGLAAAFACGIICLSLPIGWLVSKVGAKKTLLGALVGYAACVAAFPFLPTVTALTVGRFFDGAFSVGIWVAAETALLARADKANKAFVMSLYAMSLAIGYVVGPILATVVVKAFTTDGTFVVAGILALVASVVVYLKLDPSSPGDDPHAAPSSASGVRDGETASADTPVGTPAPEAEKATPAFEVFWRTKTSCFATFSYGYFQASVVLFLPLFLIEAKGVPADRTILITAFFAAGMLLASVAVSRLGDRYGHLRVMRVLGAIGGLMVASFVLLDAFWAMCIAVAIAGATLASISPVSLALQGVVTAPRDLGRANGFYNAAYAAGMLMGPPASGLFFTRYGGGPMLFHLAGLWGVFVLLTVVFASDDPRARRAKSPALGVGGAIPEAAPSGTNLG